MAPPTPIPDNLDVRFCPAIPIADLKPVIPREVCDINRLRFGRIERSMRSAGIVEPLIVKNEKRGLMVEVGNQRHLMAQKLGITHAPCIVNTVLRADPKKASSPFPAEPFYGPIPDGERLLTVEDALAKVAHVPEYASIADWGLDIHFYNFTVEESVPRGWASLSGRENCRRAVFGARGQHAHLTLTTRKDTFTGGLWSERMTAESPMTVRVLSGGDIYLLFDSGQIRLAEGESWRIGPGTGFSIRIYRSSEVVDVVLLAGWTAESPGAAVG